MRRSILPASALFALAAVTGVPTWASPPVLNSLPVYESPIHGDPDSLLLLSGSGLSAADTIVYQQLGGTSTPARPGGIPSYSSASAGVADLVSSADAPYSLAIHLPAVMAQEQSYALWAVTPDGQWSNPALINDARPVWITPDCGYVSASLANLPRQLKVVGRNLEPASAGGVTQVELVGTNTGTTYVLTALNAGNDPTGGTTAASERYLAVVDLPSSMVADQYSVQVTRDSTTWVPLLGNGKAPAQRFTVRPDPVAAATTVSVSDFAGSISGPCQPNDGIDDTACVILAIRAAQSAGGGVVNFGPGTWLISNAGNFGTNGAIYSDVTGNTPGNGNCTQNYQTCGVSYYGILVPTGVSLQGAGATGAQVTTIERGTGWPQNSPLFTVQGNNTISGFEFTDDSVYTATSTGYAALQLGLIYYFARLYSNTDPVTVANVTITNNLFNQPFEAITGRGLPADHIYITQNTFGGAWGTAIGIGQDESDVRYLVTPNTTYPYMPFTFSNTIIDYNTFYPSSFQQTASTYNGGGPVATNIGTGLYSDLSNNVADGANTQYLQSPATDPKGWRAAFFLSSGAGQDMTLVSDNTINCPGDKYGDGEGIVYDGSYSAAQMATAQPVIAAAAWTDSTTGVAGTALTVQGTVNTTVGSYDISSNPGPFYKGAWVQIIGGAGKGQWRKLDTLSLGSNASGSTVTLYVTPAFSVLPDTTSLVDLGRAYWQNTTVNNYIDQRTPLCTKANPRQTGGVISWYDSTADSVIAGNQQYDTSGIQTNHSYHPLQPGAAWSTAGAAIESSNEIRDNNVNGAYAWSSTGGVQGGIYLGFAATEYWCSGAGCTAPIPPLLGYGETVAGNTVYQASGRDDDGTHVPIGAIGAGPGWSTGPLDANNTAGWEMGDTTLIFHNTVQNISNTISGSATGLPLVGIGLDSAQGSTANPPVNWRTVLYANSCSVVDTPLADFGTSTVRYCPSGSSASSCECNGIATTDVGIAASSSASSVSAGSGVTYTITVTNNGAVTATAVTLSLEPSAGLQLGSSAFAASQGSCDSSTNVCSLGSLAAGQSATMTVNATLVTSGTWPATFSVTHHEADPVPSNDSVTTTITAL